MSDRDVMEYKEIVRKNEPSNMARMVTGYCWDWKSMKDPRAIDA